jgi:predicted acyl esterase
VGNIVKWLSFGAWRYAIAVIAFVLIAVLIVNKRFRSERGQKTSKATKTLLCDGKQFDVLFRPFAQFDFSSMDNGNFPPMDLSKISLDRLPPSILSAIESGDFPLPENMTIQDGKKLPPAGLLKLFLKLRNPHKRKTFEENGIIIEFNVPVRLRDGITMYTDIYRPKGKEKAPCIVAWSPYGKQPFINITQGVDPDALSAYTKAEGPDPLYWVKNGYAVANPDPRGTGWSEGDMLLFGDTEAKDGYDFIEWLAKRRWCNGKIGMFGNSYPAMSQWYIAAEQPPHLAAIAPWEGSSDIYRELMYEGGIPTDGFLKQAFTMLPGKNLCEDVIAMAEKLPNIDNPYWQSKIAKAEKINIPTYAAGGYSHFHIMGTFNAFQKVNTDKKWFRLHREFEWPDQYDWKQIEDVKRFFDRYLKGTYNGWEATPKIQVDVMDAYDIDCQIRRPENEFPLARTEYRKLYLDAQPGSLSEDTIMDHASVSYDSAIGEVCFDYQFQEDTELTGFMKLCVWVEAEAHDEMDLFLTVQKLDANKNLLPTSVIDQPHPGAWSKMRVSRHKLDEELSTDYRPVQSYDEEQKLSKGEIVTFEAPFFPFSRIWHKGEYLRLMITGRYVRDPSWFEPLSWKTDNKGDHIIHTGGNFDSYLQIPIIPPKHTAGDYVYR